MARGRKSRRRRWRKARQSNAGSYEQAEESPAQSTTPPDSNGHDASAEAHREALLAFFSGDAPLPPSIPLFPHGPSAAAEEQEESALVGNELLSDLEAQLAADEPEVTRLGGSFSGSNGVYPRSQRKSWRAGDQRPRRRLETLPSVVLQTIFTFLGLYGFLAGRCTSTGVRNGIGMPRRKLSARLINKIDFFRGDFLGTSYKRARFDTIMESALQQCEVTHLLGFSFEADNTILMRLLAKFAIKDLGAHFESVGTFASLSVQALLESLVVLRLESVTFLQQPQDCLLLKSALSRTCVNTLMINVTPSASSTSQSADDLFWGSVHTACVRGNVFPISSDINTLCIRGMTAGRSCPRVLGQLFNGTRALVVDRIRSSDDLANIATYFYNIEYLGVASMSDAEAERTLTPRRLSDLFPHLKGLARIGNVRRHVSQMRLHRDPWFNASSLGPRVKYSRASAFNAVYLVAELFIR